VLPSPSLRSVARSEFTHPPSPPLQRLPLTLGSLSEAAFFGVRSALIATSVRSVVCTAPSPFRVPSWSTGFQPVAVSVLSVSRALDGFFRYQPCGFISPRCHVQGSRSRGLVPPTQRLPSRRRLLPSRRFLSPSLPAPCDANSTKTIAVLRASFYVEIRSHSPELVTLMLARSRFPFPPPGFLSRRARDSFDRHLLRSCR